MGSPDDDREEGTKGNKKGRPLWRLVRHASLIVTLFLFFFTVVLVLDAYKFVSVRHAKFARKKLLRTLQYMDPSIIEAHTGMKVLTNEEFDNLESELKKSRADVRALNTKVQEKFSAVLKVSMELQNMKHEMDEMKSLMAKEETAAPEAAVAAPVVVAAAPVADPAVEKPPEDVQETIEEMQRAIEVLKEKSLAAAAAAAVVHRQW